MNKRNLNRLTAVLLTVAMFQGLSSVAADVPATPPPPVASPSPAPAPAQADNTARPAVRQRAVEAAPGGRGNRQDQGRGNDFQRGGNNGGFGGGGFNFDDKQRELLQEARQNGNEDLRKLNDKLADAQKEYVQAVVAEKYDESVVREKADTIGRLQAQILALNGKSFATISPTLKVEQREAFEGNTRIAIGIISPTLNFGGGNFAGGPPAGFGGRGSAGPGGGPGGDATGGRGGRGNVGPGGGAPGGPGGDAGDNARRRGRDNPGQ